MPNEQLNCLGEFPEHAYTKYCSMQIRDRIFSEKNKEKKERETELTPFIRQSIIQRTIAQTKGSQFPLVPIVNVNGLKSQAAMDQRRKFSGTPRSFKMASTKNPTSKSSKITLI